MITNKKCLKNHINHYIHKNISLSYQSITVISTTMDPEKHFTIMKNNH